MGLGGGPQQDHTRATADLGGGSGGWCWLGCFQDFDGAVGKWEAGGRCQAFIPALLPPLPPSPGPPSPGPPALLCAGRPGLADSSRSSLPTSGPPASSAWQAPCASDTPRDPTHTHWGLRTLKRGLRAGLLSRFCTSPTPMGQGQALTTPAGGHPQTSDRCAMSQLLAGGGGRWGGWRGTCIQRPGPAGRLGCLIPASSDAFAPPPQGVCLTFTVQWRFG